MPYTQEPAPQRFSLVPFAERPIHLTGNETSFFPASFVSVQDGADDLPHPAKEEKAEV